MSSPKHLSQPHKPAHQHTQARSPQLRVNRRSVPRPYLYLYPAHVRDSAETLGHWTQQGLLYIHARARESSFRRFARTFIPITLPRKARGVAVNWIAAREMLRIFYDLYSVGVVAVKNSAGPIMDSVYIRNWERLEGLGICIYRYYMRFVNSIMIIFIIIWANRWPGYKVFF